MLLVITIRSHAQIQALQARSDELARSKEHVYVKLVSLESMRIAHESYVILRPLMELRSCICSELRLLSVVAGMALELRKLEHDLLPQLMVQEAKLEQGVLNALLLMKSSSTTLLHLRKAFNEAMSELLDEDLVSAQVKRLSKVLKETAVPVLEGTCSIVKLREEHVPLLVQLVTDLLATPVRFSDPDQ